MKTRKHKLEAKRIGADSWELLCFWNLPESASAAAQVEALQRDQKWQQDKVGETVRAIDYLIADIEEPDHD